MELDEQQVLGLLDLIRAWHGEGKTSMAMAALHGLLQLDLAREEPRASVVRTAMQLGFTPAELAQVASDPAHLNALMDDFRELLSGATEIVRDSALMEQAGFAAGLAAGKALTDDLSNAQFEHLLPQFAEFGSLLTQAQEIGLPQTPAATANPEQHQADLQIEWQRALSLFEQGQHVEARAPWQWLREQFDALPISAYVLTARARARINGAANLDALGLHADAMAMNWDAQLLLEELPATEEVLQDRVSVRMNRANCAQNIGATELAEEIYADALSMVAALPMTERVRRSEARIRMNRASNLIALGLFADAEDECCNALMRLKEVSDSEQMRVDRATTNITRARNFRWLGRYAKADDAFREALDDLSGVSQTSTVLHDQAGLYTNWANNLDSQGRSAEAEAKYRQSNELLKRLADSSSIRRERGSLCMNWAGTLREMGRLDEAEALYLEAYGLIDQLGFSHDIFRTRARVRMNRAANLSALGRYAEAEVEVGDALKLYEGMPDTESVRFDRSQAQLNRIEGLRMAGREADAVALLDAELDLLSSLRVHTAAEVAGQLAQLVRQTGRLARSGTLAATRCAVILQTLTDWSLTWLDTMVSPQHDDVREPPPGALDAAQAVRAAISWFIETGRTELALEVLMGYHNRYASAQRLLSLASQPIEQGELTDGERIRQLKLQLRSLAGQLQAQEERDPSTRDSAFTTRRDELRDRRQRVLDELIQRLRSFREESEGSQNGFALQRVQAMLGPDHALMVLLDVVLPNSDTEQGLALLIRGSEVRAIMLPIVVAPTSQRATAVVMPGATRGSHDARGGRLLRRATDMRETVRAGWAAVGPFLSGVQQVHVAVHQSMGELPWQTAEDEVSAPRSLSVFHGLGLALHALERGTTPTVPAPEAGRRLGLLAHSPEHGRLGPIPGVYADRTVTQRLVEHHRRLEGRDELLAAGEPLLQLSCHGEPKNVLTGLGAVHTSAYELLEVLRGRNERLQACILVACSTGLAADNEWGESGGWGAVLGERADLVVGALQPVDDLLCSLFVLLLHRDWQALGDLKVALRSVRNRLRSGKWADDEQALAEVGHQWLVAIEASHDARLRPRPHEMSAAQRARKFLASRRTLYHQEPRLQCVAELFVAFG